MRDWRYAWRVHFGRAGNIAWFGRAEQEYTGGITLKTLGKATALLATLIGMLVIAQPGHAASAKCDRACLIRTANNYIAAVVAHDPSRVKFSPEVKFVENTVPMKPGEGLWKTASAGPTTFQLFVPDPVSEEVGFIGVMKENDKPIEFALRLKIRNGEITEAEHLIARDLRPTSLGNLETPRPGLLASVPPSERVPRAQMIKDALSYYTAIVTSNGKAAPFADDCVRRENGMQTTGNPPPTKPGGFATMGAMGCSAQLDTGVMSYIARIQPRRVEIVDPEKGLVFGLSQFRHPMKEKSVKIVGVPGVESVPMNRDPWDSVNAHIFKIRDGKIHEIEAMGFPIPYESKTGWE
jgi:hypothetical protein